MHLLDIIARQPVIAGLEASEDHLRLVLLAPNKLKGKMEVKALAEQPLPVGVIVDGAIATGKDAEFTRALKQVVKKLGAPVSYIILSIPANNVYSQIFRFPAKVEEAKIRESMELRAQFQLPFAPNTSYTDWEKIPATETTTESEQQAILNAIKKPIIDAYAAAVAKAGIQLVACEHHLISLARVMKSSPNAKPTLVNFETPTGTSIFVARSNNLRFGRFLPKAQVSTKEAVEKEIKRVKRFYEAAEFGEEVTTVISTKDPNFSNISANHSEWQVALGAALRGVIPRSEDTIISLLPIGTEEKFEVESRTVFIKFIRNVTIVVTLFFMAGFISLRVFIANLQHTATTQSTRSVGTQPPVNAQEVETKVKNLSALVNLAAGIIKNERRLSPIVAELNTRIGTAKGISIPQYLIPTGGDGIKLQGVAASRNDLVVFKKSLESSDLFSKVSVPLTNLGIIENIPFEATLTLKHPETLLY